MTEQEAREIIAKFHGLYSGGLAQMRRDAGQPDITAMPPWTEVYWMGRQVVKCPMDLWVYQEIIIETLPELIVETGTSGGGSAFFFATIYDLLGLLTQRVIPGHIITVDTITYPLLCLPHSRITYLVGDSLDPEIIGTIRGRAAGRRTMLSLDSLHTHAHVAAELLAYADLTTPGCYCVVEDTGYSDDRSDGVYRGDPDWCSRAAAEFVLEHPDFEVDLSRERHLLTSNHRGWLKRAR